MKKLLSIFLALVLMFSLFACSGEQSKQEDQQEQVIENTSSNNYNNGNNSNNNNGSNSNVTGKSNQESKDIVKSKNDQADADDIPTKESEKDRKDKIELTSKLIVHFIDVGQADSILIQESNGGSMLIDAGNNADANLVVNYIKEQGVDSLDYIVGTHPHEDHIGGLDAVINSFNIDKIIMPKVSHNTKTFEDVLTAISNKNLKVTSPVSGQTYELGNADFTILAPNSDTYDNLNNYSVVIKLDFGETSFMFTGDAETESENEMLAKGYDLKADILKVGHHGSITSSSAAFIKAIAPKYSVISVGKDNSYGHPDSIILNRLNTMGVEVLRTDELGTIVFTSDGKNLTYAANNKIDNKTDQGGKTGTTKPSEKTGSTGKTGPSSEPSTSTSVNVTIENIDLHKEIVTIKNHSNNDVDMTGWKLVSVKGNQVYYFPDNFILKAGASVTVASGNSEGDLKWTKNNIWNNDGDPGELYDNKGNLVSSK